MNLHKLEKNSPYKDYDFKNNLRSDISKPFNYKITNYQIKHNKNIFPALQQLQKDAKTSTSQKERKNKDINKLS